MPISNQLREWIVERNEDALLSDGYEDAIIGMAHCWRPDPPGATRSLVVVYDADKCIEILMKRDDMSEEEAEDYFTFNTLGGFIGENQPIYFWRYEPSK